MSTPEGLAALKIDRSRRKNGVPVWSFVIVAFVIAGAFATPHLIQHFDVVDVSVSPALKVRSDAARTAGSELSAAGYVVADRQSTLAAKVTGRLTKMAVAEAQRVSKGEVVAEVDHREQDAWIAQAQAEEAEAAADVERLKKAVVQTEAEIVASKAGLDVIDAEVREINVVLGDAQRRLERDKAVAEKNALPATTVEDRLTEVHAAQAKIATAAQRRIEQVQRIAASETQLGVARGAVLVAQAKVRSAEARLNVLKSQLLDYFVIAPYDGVVTEKMAELGEIVAPVSIGGGMARGSLITLADWSSLQAEVDVSETQLENVKPGAGAVITVDAFPGKAFPGKVRRILPRADRSKATVKVRVDFLKRDETVLPEMGTRVKFLPGDAPTETTTLKEHIVVPKAAVQGPSGAQFVWVAVDDHVQKRVVATGETEGDNIEIKSGLNNGEAVVIHGAEKITREHQRVRTNN
ncbi:MAG TPA: efflux RND transporter periplasmic adaptor subunit [Planctomycetota bacterium]|jgi:RND family efflux transporter MFP subunit